MKTRKVMNLLSSCCKTKVKFTALSMLLAASYISPALGESPPILPSTGFPVLQGEDNGNNPHKSRQQFERYLKDKYKDISDAETRVKQTPNGPAGDLWFYGTIIPRKKGEIDLSALPDRHAKSRAIAKAFMEDESALLGIDNPDDLREFSISTDKGGDGDLTYITYRKYINNIEYPGAVMQITVGPDYNIRSVSATFGPVSPEVYTATKKKTLTEAEIRAIVDKDLTEDEKRDFERKKGVMTFKKYAIASPPYVIWETSKEYTYTIDAFTGKILTKYSNIIPLYPNYKLQKKN